MKRFHHTLSAGIGVVLAFVAITYAAPQGRHTSPPPPFAGQAPALFPHPRDMVRVVKGTPYVVPAGKILTLKEFVATSNNSFGVTIAVDGQNVFFARTDFGEHDRLELGIVATAGQTITMSSDFGDATIAIGYLVDE